MEKWRYEIRDVWTHALLKTGAGFLTESDAETQGMMEIKADNIKGCYVRTVQEENKKEGA